MSKYFDLGSFLGGGGGLPGLESMWGNSLYRGSGAATSAKQQFKNQLALQHDAQNFSKWQMANAHQMEVQDLQNAGLNPVLSAGGGGASAGVTEGAAAAGTPVIDPISAVSGIVGTMNAAKATNAQVKQLDANIRNETKRTDVDADNATRKTNAEIDLLEQQAIALGLTNKEHSDTNTSGATAGAIKPIKQLINSAKSSVRKEKDKWKEKSKKPGLEGWKYRTRLRLTGN